MTKVYIADVCPLCDTGRLEAVINQLSPVRKKKAVDAHSEENRWLFAGAGFLLSHALKSYSLDERQAEYSYGEFGKPRFRNWDKLSFSLSHSGSMAMCAISETGEVGCDIEAPPKNGIAAVKRFFSQPEYAHIISSSEPNEEFLRLWVLKESYIKAIGTGFHTPLSSFEIIPVRPPFVRGNNKYKFNELKLDNAYYAAVCTTDEICQAPVFVDFDNILPS